MDCKGIQAELSAYIDQELSPAVQESIRLHLGVCEQCNAQYVKLLKGWQALETWEDATPPNRMRIKILESVRPQRKVVSLRAVLSMAAVLLLVVGVIVYYAGQKSRAIQDLADSQSPVQTAVGDISEDEVIANLLILQEDDFFEVLDELVMLDELPLSEEPSHSSPETEKSSLDLVFT